MNDPRKQETIASLPARRVDQVLRDLVAIRRRWREGEKVTVPMATFHLRSGRDLTGRVVDLVHEGAGPALLIHTEGHDCRWNATYLDPHAVEAVTVRDAIESAAYLSEGKVAGELSPPPDGTPPPTRLEIKRKLADQQSLLSETAGHEVVLDVSWEGVPEQGEPLRILAATIADTVDALREIARRDGAGKDAVSALRKVWFGDGGKSVLRQGDTLVVTGRYALGAPGRLSRSELPAAIEKLL